MNIYIPRRNRHGGMHILFHYLGAEGQYGISVESPSWVWKGRNKGRWRLLDTPWFSIWFQPRKRWYRFGCWPLGSRHLWRWFWELGPFDIFGPGLSYEEMLEQADLSDIS